MTTEPPPSSLAELRARAPEAGVLLDFDGSLARIVSRPEHARPIGGAREALRALVGRYRVVAIVTGRRAEEVAGLVDVEGVRYEGLYGLEAAGGSPDTAGGSPDAVRDHLGKVEDASTVVPEAWVEDKVISIAVHYRQAPDPTQARARLLRALQPIADGAGLDLVEGKLVVELVPAGRPLKGGAVNRLVSQLHLSAVLFAGDDVADLDAFEALDRLREEGLVTMKVGVRGDETPDALLRAADVVAEGPEGLVDLLRQLA